MSQAAASAFLDRLETDEAFADDLASVRGDPNAVYEKVTAAGFDATPDEIREQLMDRYGAELTPEQLDQIAAGMSDADIAGAVVGGVIGGGLAIGVVAAMAAAAL